MRYASIIAFIVLACSSASADLLWNNYLTNDSIDERTGLSSERETIIPDSWVVDDAVFIDPVEVESVSWFGAREPGAVYPAADLIVMDAQFNVVAEYADVVPTLVDMGDIFSGLTLYEAKITLPEELSLDPGQYYVGTRLVGETLGRNYALTTGNGTLNGQTEAYFRSETFGEPDWVPVSWVLSVGQSDFAFQVDGTVVPEPASIVLLASGVLLVVLRRRH
jgi:hypothetical protein